MDYNSIIEKIKNSQRIAFNTFTNEIWINIRKDVGMKNLLIIQRNLLDIFPDITLRRYL